MFTERFRESWNWSCISVRSSLPISGYMWNISRWSAKYLVSYNFSWRTRPERGQNSTVFCGGALGSACSFLSCSGRSANLDVSSWSGSAYSAAPLTSIGRNCSLSVRKIGQSTRVSRGHSSYNFLETSLWSSVTPNCNEKHASHHQLTIHAPEAPHEVYLFTRAFTVACSSSVHSGSIRCAFSLNIQTSEFQLASFDSVHLLIVQGLAIWIVRCAAACWATSSSVRIGCIKLFTVQYNASAPCLSINVSSSGSSGVPGNSHIVWYHKSLSDWNPGVAVTSSLNRIFALIAICQPTPFLVLYRWDSSQMPKLHAQDESWL